MADPTDKSEAGQDDNYVVVARRYRPRGFDELVGQEHVGRALKNAIETGRVGHAYLFTGARGVGKTSTARIFAKALNDPSGPTATPDNQSDVALAIDAGEDVDVIEIDGASNRGIDEIRSLRANVGVRPSRARFKIYIIDEVHMLTTAAFNALLKTLEEPPEHVKFIFCTTDPEKIPITVLSRCQRFDFAPVEVPKIVTRLREIVTAEKAEADDAALELLARRAAGSMRDSQSLLEQVLSFSNGNLTADHIHSMLGTADDVRLHALASAMADRDSAETMRQLDSSIDAGVDAGRLAEQLLGYFRDLMAVTVGCDPSLLRHTSASLHDELKQLGERWGLQTVLAVVGLIDDTLVRIRLSVYSRVLLEATLIQICNLPDLQHISDLAAAASNATSTARVGEKKKTSINPPHFKPASDTSRTSAPPPVKVQVDASTGNSNEQTSDADQLQASASVGSTPSTAAGSAAVAIPEQATKVTTATVAESDAASPSKTDSPASTATAPDDVASSQSVPTEWNQAAAQQVWHLALGDLESMTETFARVVTKVHAVGDHQLQLEFPAGGALAMKRCDLPEHRNAISEAVAKRAGTPISLEFVLSATKEKPKVVEPTANKPSRLQRMREIESNDLVKSCVDLFGAEIVRIEKAP
ncbi:MAG: DNA polymerase III subunit gamma/tau [Rubripirellula sp.]